VPSELPRTQTSFRLDAGLVTQLQETAERTHRTPRQVVELALQRVLPFVESGFFDSPEGRQLHAEFKEQERKSSALFQRLEAEIRAKRGQPAKEKQRKLAVFRLDGDLLARVRAAAKKTGRNDRQVVELCLQLGVPLAEVWILLEPVFDELKTVWGQLRKDLAGGPNAMPREQWQQKIRETVFQTLATVLPRLDRREMTPQELETMRARFHLPPTGSATKPAKKKSGK